MPPVFPESGHSREEVLRLLEGRLQADSSYTGAGILGSMISAAHPLAAEVYARYLDKNLGDPGLFPASAAVEREVVGMIGSLLGHPEAAGNFVSGGSEANLLALWVARTLAAGRGRRVLVPASAHVSFDKAARILELDLVKLPLTDAHVVDLDAVSAAIDGRTIALVGLAGCTPLGCVDPIEGLADLARQHGILLHVDAAFGGFVLPFLAELGLPARPFDFRLPGVSSIAVNPHKMGLAVQPAGVLLFRAPEQQAAARVAVPYLAGGETTQETVTGTRPGAAALATWALLQHLGRDGYRELVRECMDRTAWLVEQVQAIPGVDIVTPPLMNVVGIRPLWIATSTLARRLRGRRWAVSEFPAHLRVVVLPHVTRAMLDHFLRDLRDCAWPDVPPAATRPGDRAGSA